MGGCLMHPPTFNGGLKGHGIPACLRNRFFSVHPRRAERADRRTQCARRVSEGGE